MLYDAPNADVPLFETIAAALSDLGATVEHPGYVCIPCRGDLQLSVGREEAGDFLVYDVGKPDGVTYASGEIPIATAEAEIRRIHARWG